MNCVKKIFCCLLVMAMVMAAPGGLEGAEVVPYASQEGKLLLTVSEITLSIVGDSENIYAGTAPLEEVTWESGDDSVISVENGVITANSVGTTVVRASWQGQTVECSAGCLANSREELLTLHPKIIQSPKRIPPKLDMDPAPFFSDAAMVGDSITYNLMVHETKTNMLGHPLFLARKNVGVHNFVNHIIDIYYQGHEMYVEDAIAASGVKKAFFLLGMNDLGYQSPEEAAAKYAIIVDRVQEKAPDVQLYLQSCLPFHTGNNRFTNFNASIDYFNELVKQLCEEKGCIFIDLAAYIEDHGNSMSSPYTSDFEAHLNYEGSVAWMDVLRAYAYTHSDV